MTESFQASNLKMRLLISICILLGAAVFAKESIVTVYQLTLFRGEGYAYFIGGCKQFKRDGRNIYVGSINSSGNCVKLYATSDCTGERYMIIAPGKGPADERRWCYAHANIFTCYPTSLMPLSFSPC